MEIVFPNLNPIQLFRMGIFGGTHGLGRGEKGPSLQMYRNTDIDIDT